MSSDRRRVLAGLASIGPALAVARFSEAATPRQRSEAQGGRSAVPTMRPGALDDVPAHISEIGWDTDLPALLVIRYFPQRTSFKAGWDSWALGYYFHLTRSMKWSQPDPWPPFFRNAGVGANGSSFLVLGWPEEQRQLFEEWCIKRSRVVPKTIVHAVRLVVSRDDRADLVLRPLGLDADTAPSDQRVVGVGFSMTIELGLAGNASLYAVPVPAQTVARWPPSGLKLETRVHWDEPVRENGSLFIPGQPLSLRVTHNDDIVWEHAYSRLT